MGKRRRRRRRRNEAEAHVVVHMVKTASHSLQLSKANILPQRRCKHSRARVANSGASQTAAVIEIDAEKRA